MVRSKLFADLGSTGVALIAVVATAVSLTGCEYQSGHMATSPIPTSFSSNGERIYFTGTSERKSEIRFSGGGMHMRMMGGSCATCHGADRQGGLG